MNKRTWTPDFPKLAYAEGPKCLAKPERKNSGAWVACIKPTGHDGKHLKDIHPSQMAPKA